MSDIIKLRRDTASNWTSNNPVLAAGELGYETDTSKLKVGDGVTAWSSLGYSVEPSASGLSATDIGTIVQAYSANLDAIAALTGTQNNFLQGTGSTFESTNPATTRTNLGYGNLADNNTIASSDFSEALSIANGGTGATSASAARTALGLEIGTDVEAYSATVLTDSAIGVSVQAYDSNLTSFVSTFTLPTADGTANYGISTNGSGTLSFAAVAAGMSIYSTEDELPLDSTVSQGDMAYVSGTDSIYIWNGSAWRYFALSELSNAWVFQGSNYGYTSGGYDTAFSNVIDKFPFAADANATDVGDLTTGRRSMAGQSSADYGYNSGGYGPGYSNVIEKFPFTTDGNSADVGDLTQARQSVTGQSSESYGYSSGGFAPPYTNVIDKFPVAADANATDVGDLINTARDASGQSSTTHGYVSGGITPAITNVIQKFPFTADGNAADVGNLTTSRTQVVGQSSADYGYVSGGNDPAPGYIATIDKFSFAADANATAGGDLTIGRAGPVAQSSTTHGYNSGGDDGPNPIVNIIDKFSFSTDTNATDVGDLTGARKQGAGQQY